jgi:hypothetical protein
MLIGTMLAVTTTLCMSIATAIAIFRYRLWDIDIIIRRTLAYSLLTTILAVIYFSFVLLLTQVFGAITGQENSPFANVIATLVIAAMFMPLRRRIQEVIDRRFYRRKYDAEKIAAVFGTGLRQEMDIEQLSQRLLAVTEETMQPESLSLWMKKKD